ncbi:hypothetical protein TruAng_000520 [Truncatella angustata]|nr:hypothetical protein TruAng_000520 [Truncatella angustata]
MYFSVDSKADGSYIMISERPIPHTHYSNSWPLQNSPPAPVQPQQTLKHATKVIKQQEHLYQKLLEYNINSKQDIRSNLEDRSQVEIPGQGSDIIHKILSSQKQSIGTGAGSQSDPPTSSCADSELNDEQKLVAVPFVPNAGLEISLPNRNSGGKNTGVSQDDHENGRTNHPRNVETPITINADLNSESFKNVHLGPKVDLVIDTVYEEEILDDAISSNMTSIFDGSKRAKSSVTSAQPTESPNAVDSLVNGLIYDTILQYLWPQLFLRLNSKNVSRAYVTRLLFRYSLDLQNLAQNMKESESYSQRIRAARFVERKREALAQEICNWFQLPAPQDDEAEPQFANLTDLPIETDRDIEIQDIEQEDSAQVDLLKNFLFQTDPFYYFRENVRALVEQPLVLPFRIRSLDYARRWFDNVGISLRKPTLQTSQQRVYYTCKCGQKLYDDYSESRQGALLELKLLLSQYGIQTFSTGDVESQIPQAPATNSKIPPSLPSKQRGRHPDIRLPIFWQGQNKIELGKCRTKLGSNEAEDKHNYVLTCLPFGRFVSKLRQPEVCTVDSDQDFFALLRVMYRENRSKLPLSLLRRVKSIKFVQMEMYHKDLADIRSYPSLPSDNHKDQYFYDPMPADLMPPIGSNLLVHLFENPTHAGVLPNLYSRIPKKLREKLAPCPQKGTSVGWGLAFTEGIDTFIFFLCGCLGFLVCLVVALVWTATKGDVQGGFGIGAFLLSFMVFCGGLIHSSIAVTGQH